MSAARAPASSGRLGVPAPLPLRRRDAPLPLRLSECEARGRAVGAGAGGGGGAAGAEGGGRREEGARGLGGSESRTSRWARGRARTLPPVCRARRSFSRALGEPRSRRSRQSPGASCDLCGDRPGARRESHRAGQERRSAGRAHARAGHEPRNWLRAHALPLLYTAPPPPGARVLFLQGAPAELF